MIWWGKKYLLMVAATLAAFFVTLAKVFRFGKKVEQRKRTEKTLKIAITRFEVEDEVNKKSDVDIRSDLSEWVRKE
ncbi:hypothetical protein [Bartonella sp. WD12.1]|uniref:hypothetical protein n=1 Tax=Bartonella sp. WD12.1 TaxID=1933903 RepID=UPI000999A379|nr:hypothetical protein [Bartonella sp. WD12.1]OPB29496.1 hypothetical protein BWD121_005160 [Bartonella sp. WD12.1]